MKNVVFGDIKAQFGPQRRHISFPLQCPDGQCYVRFEVSMAVTHKNVVVWDVRRVALVRTDVSEEFRVSIIRLTSIGEVGTTLADYCHPDDGGDTFLRNVGSYKSHTL
jgi:hypothetical protein